MTPLRERPATAPREVLAARELDGLQVAETLVDGLLRLTAWEALDPALVCGVTTAAHGDYCVVGEASARVATVYAELARGLGFDYVSVPTQVHGTRIREVSYDPLRDATAPFVAQVGHLDGQFTAERGCLLAATAADCVPVYLWRRTSRQVGLIHAGWRGTAAGILGRALARLGRRGDGAGPALRVHLGPAICGRCYEVDTPVLKAFGFAGERARLDLRGLLSAQAVAAGVDRAAISSSRHCTACGPARLHSHRASGGIAGRMAAFVGLRHG
ncbi:polyphenol oxidase family protein [Candidatus Palauibacter sp.]|uniref:polyphenol oxidase family protein n=1 Tax=Candidatus Palauibacter sp. TaxID=3101350 RepID=UPI003AF2D1F0